MLYVIKLEFIEDRADLDRLKAKYLPQGAVYDDKKREFFLSSKKMIVRARTLEEYYSLFGDCEVEEYYSFFGDCEFDDQG